jgi:hypothetical protein
MRRNQRFGNWQNQGVLNDHRDCVTKERINRWIQEDVNPRIGIIRNTVNAHADILIDVQERLNVVEERQAENVRNPPEAPFNFDDAVVQTKAFIRNKMFLVKRSILSLKGIQRQARTFVCEKYKIDESMIEKVLESSMDAAYEMTSTERTLNDRDVINKIEAANMLADGIVKKNYVNWTYLKVGILVLLAVACVFSGVQAKIAARVVFSFPATGPIVDLLMMLDDRYKDEFVTINAENSVVEHFVTWLAERIVRGTALPSPFQDGLIWVVSSLEIECMAIWRLCWNIYRISGDICCYNWIHVLISAALFLSGFAKRFFPNIGYHVGKIPVGK